MHGRIAAELKAKFSDVPIDGRFLQAAQERAQLASKVAIAEDANRKRKFDTQWFQEQADAAELELDEDFFPEETQDKREKAQQSNIEQSKRKLKALLSRPLKVHKFGKFLSTNGSFVKSTVVRQEPSGAQVSGRRKKKRKEKI